MVAAPKGIPKGFRKDTPNTFQNAYGKVPKSISNDAQPAWLLFLVYSFYFGLDQKKGLIYEYIFMTGHEKTLADRS